MTEHSNVTIFTWTNSQSKPDEQQKQHKPLAQKKLHAAGIGHVKCHETNTVHFPSFPIQIAAGLHNGFGVPWIRSHELNATTHWQKKIAEHESEKQKGLGVTIHATAKCRCLKAAVNHGLMSGEQ
jgi:hypothetical protein